VEVVAVEVPMAQITPEVVETLLETLVENSRQAGADRVTIRIEPAGDDVILWVTDDGPGIAVADLERIFEPFFTGRREAGGTGLGLAIARSLLAATGGTIMAKEVPAGACFRLRLPVA
jgi:signal transduction histidine kinase